MACNISPIFFLLVSSLLSLSCVMAQDALNKVCAKTSNPGFCFSVLRSDRRSATADYTGLRYIAIDLATSSITSTYDKLMVLDRVTRNPGFKEHLGFCIHEYESAVDSCSDAREFLTEKSYECMYVAGISITTSANDCETGFKADKPYYPSPITNNNRDTEVFADIIRVIAFSLRTSRL